MKKLLPLRLCLPHLLLLLLLPRLSSSSFDTESSVRTITLERAVRPCANRETTSSVITSAARTERRSACKDGLESTATRLFVFLVAMKYEVTAMNRMNANVVSAGKVVSVMFACDILDVNEEHVKRSGSVFAMKDGEDPSATKI